MGMIESGPYGRISGASQPDFSVHRAVSIWSVVQFCDHTSGDFGAGTLLGFRFCVKMSFEASRSATVGEPLETVLVRIEMAPALVNLEVLSKVGEGGETGVIAAGAMINA